MQIFKEADPDKEFLEEIRDWMLENGMRGKILLVANPFLAVLLGYNEDPIKFVCFHKPLDNEEKVPYGMRRYYDPNFVDYRIKKQVIAIYERWQAQSAMLVD